MGLFRRKQQKPAPNLEEVLQRPEVEQQLRAAGIDPEILEGHLGEAKVTHEGDKTTYKLSTTTHIRIPADSPPPPASDDGDEVWKKGEL
jgi:hypothetical protein